jgi:hypothetical protein
VPLLRLVDPLALLATKAYLKRIVTVLGTFLLLYNNARPGLDKRDRDDVSVRIVKLRHANFFPYKACHGAFQLLQFDFHVHAGSDIQLPQGVDGLLGRL